MQVFNLKEKFLARNVSIINVVCCSPTTPTKLLLRIKKMEHTCRKWGMLWMKHVLWLTMEEYLWSKASYVVLNGVLIAVNLQFFFLICVRWSIILIVCSVQPPKLPTLTGLKAVLISSWSLPNRVEGSALVHEQKPNHFIPILFP